MVPVHFCRNCSSKSLVHIAQLGDFKYTGIFPTPGTSDSVPSGHLGLVICQDCGLVQLDSFYEPSIMYGDHYGYASSITRSMTQHLFKCVNQILDYFPISNSLNRYKVLDIGCNDCTMLSAYPPEKFDRYGIDPSSKRFRGLISDDISVIEQLFSKDQIIAEFGHELKFDVISSFSMLYDLDDPNSFLRDVADLLSPGGLWVAEQTHSKFLIEELGYDSICHEHALYLSYENILKMASNAGLYPIDVVETSTNGASYLTFFTNDPSKHEVKTKKIKSVLEYEAALELTSLDVWSTFASRVNEHKSKLLDLITRIKLENKKIACLGASTKGNVLLQYLGLSSDDIVAISERDSRKVGLVTPGTNIPILSEDEVRMIAPDYLIVMPWHFASEIIEREKQLLQNGTKLIFPLPFEPKIYPSS